MEVVKKILPLALVVLVVIVIAVLGIIGLSSKKSQNTSLPAFSEVTLPITDRPFINLIPRADGHELKLNVSNIKQANSVDYELVYLAGDISRGVIGSVDLKSDNSLSRDLLLGSCSKNVCKYDEGVQSGTLTLKMRGQGVQKYEVAFLIEQGGKDKKELTLDDNNFKFAGILPAKSFYVLSSTVGLPKVPDGNIVGGPYAVFGEGKNIKGSITIKLSEAAPSARVLVWDGSLWKEISSGFETDGKSVSVDINNVGTFVAVAS